MPRPKNANVSSADAWANVVTKLVQGRRESRKLLGKSVHKVAVRWRGTRIATSGIEQGFTSVDLKITNRQGAAASTLEESMVKIILDGRRDDLDKVSELARQSWRDYSFGKPRKSGSARAVRFDKGVPRKRKQDPNTEATSIRDRQQEGPAEPTMSYTDACNAIDSVIVDSWGPEHDKEVEFTCKKEKKRRA